jgi:hypothetical protein
MKSRIWLNIFLLLLVVALALVVYAKRHAPAEQTHPLSMLNAAQVAAIQIEKPNTAAVHLEKRNDAWFVTAPFSARADSFRISRILEILAASSAQTFPATDLTAFDLDKPLLKLTIDGQPFSFGTLNPLTQQQYALTANTVYLISARYMSNAAVQTADFADKRLFAENEMPVRFEFAGRVLALNEGKWETTPLRTDSSQDTLNKWRDEWHQALALLAQPYVDGKSSGEILITLNGGKKIALSILQQAPDLVLLREDERMQYHFPQDIGKQLLAPLEAVQIHPAL